jgi:hypothetical protein
MPKTTASAPQPGRGLKLQALFPLAVGQVQLQPDPLDLALQLQAIRELQAGADSNPDPGCAWTGDLNGVWQLDRDPRFSALIAGLLGHAWSYLEQLGFDRDRIALHLQRCWPVVSELGQVVGRHHHPNAHLSGVYYLNGDGSGRSGCLRLFTPSALNELVPGLAVGHGGPILNEGPAAAQWNAPWFDLAPRAGLLVLFPAGLEHMVLENRDANDSRFSISFDLVLTSPPCPTPGQQVGEYLAPHPSAWTAVPADRIREKG